MLIKLFLIIAGSISMVALYFIMVLLATMSMENELPDLEDVEV